MVNFGGGCYISGGIFDLAKGQDSDRGHDKYTRGPIRIGRKCRFGMRSIVLDGVHVGEGSIVGAMSLVNNDLPEYVVAAGVPAKVLKSRFQDSSES
jgi:acetyltransferase-like isoleucine patch superfamily enzyme